MQRKKPCPNLDVNLKNCNCTYPSCDKKGKCCECIRFHRERNELPSCLFPSEVEKTYDRSIERFVAIYR
ncbi:MAG: DUF6485 family protein [Candidatus Bathyarchaeota archaeon]|nr:DUF6485 family protein [Candidatus Bathyarchaeota archaeon]MDH5495571.1 DUF6485 family protein [Candidatus Bathyarchaeota archaeon]